MRIILDGAGGMLGSEIYRKLNDDYDVMAFWHRQDLDLCNYKIVREVAEEADLWIHTAAMKDVDTAEKNEKESLRINTLATKNIALATGNVGIPIIHFSTSSVFDGHLNRSYNEFDPTHPLNYYGYTKLLAEENVKLYNRKHFILRVPLLFGAHGNPLTNPLLKMKELLDKGEKRIPYAIDQITNPTSCADVASAICCLITSDIYGTYHVCNIGEASRYDMHLYCANQLGYSKEYLQPVSAAVKFAPREKKVILDGSLFENTFNIKMRNWCDAMDEVIQECQ